MPNDASGHVIFRHLGLHPYAPVWARMREFTDARDTNTCDEIWLLQHTSVFTLGQAGKECHLLDPGVIPVINSDRGGQVTYHGPGQIIAYLLVDLRRRGLGVKVLVNELEAVLIDVLGELEIDARRRDKAPGVYVADKKIASLGLRVRKNCSFHGLSLNMSMDLAPFSRINVCGYEGLEVTQISDLTTGVDERSIIDSLQRHLIRRLGYHSHEIRQNWS